MKSVLILIALFFIVRAVKQRFVEAPKRPAPKPVERPASSRAQSEEMVLDPVCGSYVPVSTEFKIEDGGKTVYFCSGSCADKYRENV